MKTENNLSDMNGMNNMNNMNYMNNMNDMNNMNCMNDMNNTCSMNNINSMNNMNNASNANDADNMNNVSNVSNASNVDNMSNVSNVSNADNVDNMSNISSVSNVNCVDRVLVVGSGGREHAIVWKLSLSPRVSKIYCAPGNGGIASLAECVGIAAADVDGVVRFAIDNNIGLVFVAPEDPLARGMADALEAVGVRVFGPQKSAALIESSKIFSKGLMKKYGIPTAEYECFEDAGSAEQYLDNCGFPIVIKAEGLALGKGVIIAETIGEAKKAVRDMMDDKVFGEAGSRIVIEEFLTGREFTVLAFTDGKTVSPMASSQDHKRVFDGDKGQNTGGMGAYAPSPIYTPEIANYCMKHIYKPTIDALNKEGRKFKGAIYFGLIMTADGVKVIEYNARLGDPESQVVLPLLENDLMDVIDAVIDERLSELDIRWSNEACACIVAVSGGYPGGYCKGFGISGLGSPAQPGADAGAPCDGAVAQSCADTELPFTDTEAPCTDMELPCTDTELPCTDTELPCTDMEQHSFDFVFHSGTSAAGGEYLTAGGRVLGVTSRRGSLEEAIGAAYERIAGISFEGMHYRKDIGLGTVK